MIFQGTAESPCPTHDLSFLAVGAAISRPRKDADISFSEQ